MQLTHTFLSRLFLLPATLLIASVAQANIPDLEVNGNTISWPSTGYMQVQNAETFETVCEGNQSSCQVPAGTYIVIDHSAGLRQEDVLVVETDQPISMPFTQVTELRIEESAFPGNKYSIRAECPGGMIPIGGGCQGLISDGTFSDDNFMPGSGHLAPVLRSYVCNFMDPDFNAGREVQLRAQATCVFFNEVQLLTNIQ